MPLPHFQDLRASLFTCCGLLLLLFLIYVLKNKQMAAHDRTTCQRSGARVNNLNSATEPFANPEPAHVVCRSGGAFLSDVFFTWLQQGREDRTNHEGSPKAAGTGIVTGNCMYLATQVYMYSSTSLA